MKKRPTQRASDAGALRVARFLAFFYASAFSQADGVPPPAHTRVTPTVGRLITQSLQIIKHKREYKKHD